MKDPCSIARNRSGEELMVDIGQSAPDFTLPAHDGETVTLSQYRGQKNVILSFHIFSFTGG